MKFLFENPDDSCSSGIKLGIIRLGFCCNKIKYTLLDERDISLARIYVFEAKLEIDKNGNGAKISAMAYKSSKSCPATGQYLHDLIWERHRGGIADGFHISHKNGIRMDNRIENLEILPKNKTIPNNYSNRKRICKSSSLSSDDNINHTNKYSDNIETTLYWAAIQQLPPNSTDENFNESDYIQPTQYILDANGNVIEENETFNSYYECHYSPCIQMEREPKEFSICGRCQEVRYCGPICQQRDWLFHKTNCREKKSLSIISYQIPGEFIPER